MAYFSFLSLRASSVLAATAVVLMAALVPAQAQDSKVSVSAPAGQQPSSQAPAASSVQGPAEAGGNKTLSLADQNLMRELAQAHLAEAKMAALATAISSDPAIRTYAEKMLEEHLKVMAELRQLADQHKVVLPGGVEQEQAALLHKLSLLTGQEFNQLYLAEAGVTLHQAAHKLFEQASNRAQSPELKAFAAKLAPIAMQHLQLAQHMQNNPDTALNAVQATILAGQFPSAYSASAIKNRELNSNPAARGAAAIAGSATGVGK